VHPGGSSGKEDDVHRVALFCLIAAASSLIVLSVVDFTGAGTLNRDRDPLVLTGSSLPHLIGTDPDLIVAYRYDGGWLRIPVQIDERAVVDFGTIYGSDPSGYTVLTYTDTSTFTGPDPDTTFDLDDELVLMVKDAGPEASASAEPGGAISGSGVELTITHSLSADTAYAYLFVSDGSIGQWTGPHPVAYTFTLLSGDYKTTYNTMAGPNPEDTDIVTAAYAVHFSDRWIRDEMTVTKGGATGIDILDRHRSLFAPGDCARSEDTFSAGEGAFIINREGPVRALRGYVGCNSGPTTYRIHAFYEEREDILTALRVHAIKGIIDFYDYSPQAAGMTYYNDLNMSGVTIDGNPDTVVPGEVTWDMVTGTQGTVVHTLAINTDIPAFDYSSYYCDDSTPPYTQCTGDDYEYGASGFWEEDPIPNTDPGIGPYYTFEAVRIIAYGGPDQAIGFADTCATQALGPPEATASTYDPNPGASVDVPDHESCRAPRVDVHPNPVEVRMWVCFELDQGTRLKANLFDIRGRSVCTLIDGYRPGGQSLVVRDLSGLRPGIYFLRVRTDWGWAPAVRVIKVN
jgi:hypothetical protein